jgi:pyruvate kinase
MLNKGPYIVEAVRFLNGLLERMAAHQSKKRARLRRLSVSHLASLAP